MTDASASPRGADQGRAPGAHDDRRPPVLRPVRAGHRVEEALEQIQHVIRHGLGPA
ncbi:GntR family transcriptional regulator, partial [Streptomyces albidoflavus]